VLSVGLGELVLSRYEAFRPYPRYAPGEHADVPSLSSFLRPDPTIGWSMRPSFEYRHTTAEFNVVYRSNAGGFRSKRELAETLARKHVLLVGDSYTFGIAVDGGDTFGARVEAGSGLGVCNRAMPGFAVDQMWLQVRRGLRELSPELVIVAVCDADLARSQTAFSLSNGMNKPAFRLADGRLVARTTADRLGPLVHALEHHSHLWMGLRQGLRRIGYLRPWGEWWRLNAALLDALRADCAAAGVPLLLVYVPTPERRPFPTLAAYASRAGLHYVDLTEGLPREGMFYRTDRHFTPAGHAFAAGRILAAIDGLANRVAPRN